MATDPSIEQKEESVLNGHSAIADDSKNKEIEVNGMESENVSIVNGDSKPKTSNEGGDDSKNKDTPKESDKKETKVKAIVRYDE